MVGLCILVYLHIVMSTQTSLGVGVVTVELGPVERQVQILKAVAHETRLRIVAILADQATCVSDLADALDCPQSVISQHLRILRMNKLVSKKHENGYSVYSLAEPRLRQLLRCVRACQE